MENRMVFIRIPRYLLKTMTPLFDTKAHVRKSKPVSLKCPAPDAWVINTNCSVEKALLPRPRAGPVSSPGLPPGGKMSQLLLAWSRPHGCFLFGSPEAHLLWTYLHVPEAGPQQRQGRLSWFSAEEDLSGAGVMGEQSCSGLRACSSYRQDSCPHRF